PQMALKLEEWPVVEHDRNGTPGIMEDDGPNGEPGQSVPQMELNLEKWCEVEHDRNGITGISEEEGPNGEPGKFVGMDPSPGYIRQLSSANSSPAVPISSGGGE